MFIFNVQVNIPKRFNTVI